MAATVPQYLLREPTERDALSSLAKIQGPERARTTWQRVRQRIGLDGSDAPLTEEQLRQAAQELLREPGLAPVVGRTLIIRLESFRSLADHRGLAPSDDEGTP